MHRNNLRDTGRYYPFRDWTEKNINIAFPDQVRQSVLSPPCTEVGNIITSKCARFGENLFISALLCCNKDFSIVQIVVLLCNAESALSILMVNVTNAGGLRCFQHRCINADSHKWEAILSVAG